MIQEALGVALLMFLISYGIYNSWLAIFGSTVLCTVFFVGIFVAHEGAHAFFIIFFGHELKEVTFTHVMWYADNVSHGQRVLISLAGPAADFLLCYVLYLGSFARMIRWQCRVFIFIFLLYGIASTIPFKLSAVVASDGFNALFSTQKALAGGQDMVLVSMVWLSFILIASGALYIPVDMWRRR